MTCPVWMLQKIAQERAQGKQIWLRFGVSANPWHLGHEAYLHAAASFLRPDRVFLVPAKLSPFKLQVKQENTASKRAMMEAAAEQYLEKYGSQIPWTLEIDFQEIESKEAVSYTWKSIHHAVKRASREKASLFLLLTDETVQSFYRWQKALYIVEHSTLVYGCRRAAPFDPERFIEEVRMQAHACFVHPKVIQAIEQGYIPIKGSIEVSSTEIRRRLSDREEIASLVGPKVALILETR